MIIKTKPYGEMEIDSRQKIHFPWGLLGFENLKEYVLIDSEQPPFYWLQSLEVSEIAFVLIKPTIFRPEYDPHLSTEDKLLIGLESNEDQLVFSIVTIPEDSSRMTANLQGPIVINKQNRNGRQYILSDPRWKIRHGILSELSAQGEDPC